VAEFDPRIVKIGIEVDGVLRVYDGLKISATGAKFGNENPNECEVKISNLSADVRDYILTETSPFNQNRTRKKIVVYAGRESYGAPIIYVGDITTVSVSQPPDIELTIKALTDNHAKGDVIAKTAAPKASLSSIAKSSAETLGLSLDFQAEDKQVGNYAFSGGATGEVGKIGAAGDVDAFVDDTTLVIKPAGYPLAGRVRLLNIDTGLIGQPEFTERGIKVTYLIDETTKLGGGLRVESLLNPSINGLYVIYKLNFAVANRDTPFYWIAECTRAVT